MGHKAAQPPPERDDSRTTLEMVFPTEVNPALRAAVKEYGARMLDYLDDLISKS